tara:strand:- start:173 stop:880 length:708 start_codon:yes stop_codon:yes gene_type:complete
MKMLVLAGGLGTRLKNTLTDLPKPMAPINGIPMLKLQLEHWVMQGQKNFIFLLYHKSEIIIELLLECSNYFGKSVNIDWLVEDNLMGTGGAIANVIQEQDLSGTVLVTNADTWLNDGINDIKKNNHSSVIGVIEVSDIRRYGSVSLNSKNQIVDFIEKQTDKQNPASGIINAGLYKLSTNLFKDYVGSKFSLEEKIFPKLLQKKKLFAQKLNGVFFDIGLPEDYYRFCKWHETKE